MNRHESGIKTRIHFHIEGYGSLPQEQRVKDHLFIGVIDSFR